MEAGVILETTNSALVLYMINDMFYNIKCIVFIKLIGGVYARTSQYYWTVISLVCYSYSGETEGI